MPVVDRSSRSMRISIADIGFLISSVDMPLLIGPNPATYEPFMASADIRDAGAQPIPVDLKIKDLPRTGQLTEIFRCGDSWAMCKKGAEYYLVLNPSLPGGPECVARFDHAFEKVTIYCGDMTIVEVEGKKMVRNPLIYPLDQLLMMYVLAHREGALFHSSFADVGGKGCLFPGKSGAGKSTISRLLSSAGHEALSDDRVIVRKVGEGFRAFGTPWPGDAGIAINKDLPLTGIYFLMQSKTNRIAAIGPNEALERLMPVTTIPWYDAGTLTMILAFCNELVSAVPSYDLHFTPDQKAADLLEGFVSG